MKTRNKIGLFVGAAFLAYYAYQHYELRWSVGAVEVANQPTSHFAFVDVNKPSPISRVGFVCDKTGLLGFTFFFKPNLVFVESDPNLETKSVSVSIESGASINYSPVYARQSLELIAASVGGINDATTKDIAKLLASGESYFKVTFDGDTLPISVQLKGLKQGLHEIQQKCGMDIIPKPIE